MTNSRNSRSRANNSKSPTIVFMQQAELAAEAYAKLSMNKVIQGIGLHNKKESSESGAQIKS